MVEKNTNIIKKILFILNKTDKTRLIFIFIMMLISALLDLIGLSAILPIISILNTGVKEITPNNINQFNNVVKFFYNIFHISNVDNMAILLLCILGVFFLIKTSYAFLCTYINSKFTMSFNRRLVKRQMETYLSMPYEYHLNNNSSTLIRKSTYDVNLFTSAVSNVLSFVVKVITTITIVVYLLITDWLVTLIIGGALGLFSILIVFILKPHLKAVAKRNQMLNSKNYKYLSQAFNGIKESKISNSESYFVNMYYSNIKDINRMSIRQTMYHSVPGHSLELVGMAGLIVALILVILTKNPNNNNSYIIETFAVFAYAVIKLLPCVTEVNSFFNNMAGYSISINTIYKDINEANDLQEAREMQIKEHDQLPYNREISINNVKFAYTLAPDKIILNDVSCIIKKNTSVAFCGESGAGKTTMIDNILGLLKPQSGTICCDGVDIQTNMKGWRDNISYIPQTIFLMDDTIRRNIAFGIADKNINDDMIWDALEKAQLYKFVKALPNGLDTVIGERGVRLSGGQRQRLGIARAFYRNTNIIVFDEATSALDYENEKKILDHVNQYASDHTLIIITHRLNTIENCDHIYKIANGGIETIK